METAQEKLKIGQVPSLKVPKIGQVPSLLFMLKPEWKHMVNL